MIAASMLLAFVGPPAAAAPPVATFTWSVTSSGGLTAVCHASDPDGGSASCTWRVELFDESSDWTFLFFVFGDVLNFDLAAWPGIDLCAHVQVTVTDGAGETSVYDDPVDAFPDCAPTNTAPSVDAGPDQWNLPARAFTLNAAVSDPDANDAHTATIEWGDGSSGSAAVVDGTVVASHSYRGAGAWTITVCVTDAAGATGCDAMQLEQRGSEAKLPAAALPGQGKAKGLA